MLAKLGIFRGTHRLRRAFLLKRQSSFILKFKKVINDNKNKLNLTD